MSLYRNFIVNCIVLKFSTTDELVAWRRKLYAKFGSINLAKMILIFDETMLISAPDGMFIADGVERFITDDDIAAGFCNMKKIKGMISDDTDTNTNLRRDQSADLLTKVTDYANECKLDIEPLRWRIVESTADTTDINSSTRYVFGKILDFRYITPKVDASLLKRLLN